MTGPRMAILAALEQDTSHPNAEGLHERLRIDHPSMSLSTVYKTLEAFLKAGLCRRVSGDGTRLRVDGALAGHDHAVCRCCGRIFDVSNELVPSIATPERLPNGLAVTAVRVEYVVICPRCEGREGLASRAATPPRPAGEQSS